MDGLLFAMESVVAYASAALKEFNDLLAEAAAKK